MDRELERRALWSVTPPAHVEGAPKAGKTSVKNFANMKGFSGVIQKHSAEREFWAALRAPEPVDVGLLKKKLLERHYEVADKQQPVPASLQELMEQKPVTILASADGIHSYASSGAGDRDEVVSPEQQALELASLYSDAASDSALHAKNASIKDALLAAEKRKSAQLEEDAKAAQERERAAVAAALAVSERERERERQAASEREREAKAAVAAANEALAREREKAERERKEAADKAEKAVKEATDKAEKAAKEATDKAEKAAKEAADKAEKAAKEAADKAAALTEQLMEARERAAAAAAAATSWRCAIV